MRGRKKKLAPERSETVKIDIYNEGFGDRPRVKRRGRKKERWVGRGGEDRGYAARRGEKKLSLLLIESESS